MTETQRRFPLYLRGSLAQGRKEGRKDMLLFLCRERYGKECANTLAELLERLDSRAELRDVCRLLVISEGADDFLAHAQRV